MNAAMKIWSYSPISWVEDAMCRMYPGRESYFSGIGLQRLDGELIYSVPIVGLMGDPDWARATCVLASPCVDHCAGNESELTASIAADLLLGLYMSRQLQLPMVTFIGTGEEIFLTPGGTSRALDWIRVAKYVAQLGKSWARNSRAVRFFSTDDDAVWDTISKQTRVDRPRIQQAQLDGLHRLADDRLYPQGTRFTYLYDYYRSNISHYRSPVLESLAHADTQHVLIVENVQQIKCIDLARTLNDADGVKTSHLVTCPLPDISNTVRVSRAEAHNRIMLTDFLFKAPPPAREYWSYLSGLKENFGNL